MIREDIAVDLGVIVRLLRLSAGGVGQMLIATASYVGLIRILATFGRAELRWSSHPSVATLSSLEVGRGATPNSTSGGTSPWKKKKV